jgi:hypothetical protein
MIPILTEDQINSCLLAINHAYKKGDINPTNEHSLEINKQLITFIFDKRLGRRGGWIPKTNIKVIYKEDDDPKN